MSPLIITSYPLFTVKTLSELKLRNCFKCLYFTVTLNWRKLSSILSFDSFNSSKRCMKQNCNWNCNNVRKFSLSFLSLSSPTVTCLCSQVEVDVRGPALDCLSADPRVPHRSITCKYLRTKLVCSWEMWFCFLVSKFRGVTIFAPCFVRKSE